MFVKAKGKMFNKWTYYVDYKHFKFNFNDNGIKQIRKISGDIYNLNDFIEHCEMGAFINYDGYAREIVFNDKVIWQTTLFPSDVLFWKRRLKEFNSTYNNKLHIAWYNR